VDARFWADSRFSHDVLRTVEFQGKFILNGPQEMKRVELSRGGVGGRKDEGDAQCRGISRNQNRDVLDGPLLTRDGRWR